jgi:hypothetical protein
MTVGSVAREISLIRLTGAFRSQLPQTPLVLVGEVIRLRPPSARPVGPAVGVLACDPVRDYHADPMARGNRWICTEQKNKMLVGYSGKVGAVSITNGELVIGYTYDGDIGAGEFRAPMTGSDLDGTWTENYDSAPWAGTARLRYVSHDGHFKFFGTWEGGPGTKPPGKPTLNGEWAGEFDLLK